MKRVQCLKDRFVGFIGFFYAVIGFAMIISNLLSKPDGFDYDYSEFSIQNPMV